MTREVTCPTHRNLSDPEAVEAVRTGTSGIKMNVAHSPWLFLGTVKPSLTQRAITHIYFSD
uniref:hypothetical protein n=1 Tax=Paenibacillus radicibacter TaxID=2972488 RepID=UPI00280A9850|nr:hypothetical protein [Paenibacillus radicibacter]